MFYMGRTENTPNNSIKLIDTNKLELTNNSKNQQEIETEGPYSLYKTINSDFWQKIYSDLYSDERKERNRLTERILDSHRQQEEIHNKLKAMLNERATNQSPTPIVSTPQPLQQPNWPKRTCRPPPLPKKFGQQCHCGQSNHNKYFTTNNNTNNNNGTQGEQLPSVAYSSPLHLYDPISKKCLPTSRNRDMLLKECHLNYHHHPKNKFTYVESDKGTCYYDDLICDPRKNRCICKPTLHLFYENNSTSFGCVPIGSPKSPDGKISCKPGYMYNVITKDCHKIFDVNDLQSGVSATQFSFVTIIFIWILLLIIILFAKLRKLRSSNMYRNTPQSERRLHHHNNGSTNVNSGGVGHAASYRHHHRANRSNWLHPFISAVNGHHQHTTGDRLPRSTIVDDGGNYNDTDFFLRRANDMISENNFTSSQQSLNNPPPKFEEIYPSCTPVTVADATAPTVDEIDNIRPPSNEDLPSYDEAMKLQNTMPPDISKE